MLTLLGLNSAETCDCLFALQYSTIWQVAKMSDQDDFMCDDDEDYDLVCLYCTHLH